MHRQRAASSFCGSKHTSAQNPGALGFSHEHVFGFTVPPNGQTTAHGARETCAKATPGIIVKIVKPRIAVLSAKTICLSNAADAMGREKFKAGTVEVEETS